MIQSSHALVTLKPARQAALQAIMSVEDARQRGTRLPSMPHGCNESAGECRHPGTYRQPVQNHA